MFVLLLVHAQRQRRPQPATSIQASMDEEGEAAEGKQAPQRRQQDNDQHEQIIQAQQQKQIIQAQQQKIEQLMQQQEGLKQELEAQKQQRMAVNKGNIAAIGEKKKEAVVEVRRSGPKLESGTSDVENTQRRNGIRKVRLDILFDGFFFFFVKKGFLFLLSSFRF